MNFGELPHFNLEQMQQLPSTVDLFIHYSVLPKTKLQKLKYWLRGKKSNSHTLKIAIDRQDEYYHIEQADRNYWRYSDASLMLTLCLTPIIARYGVNYVNIDEITWISWEPTSDLPYRVDKYVPKSVIDEVTDAICSRMVTDSLRYYLL